MSSKKRKPEILKKQRRCDDGNGRECHCSRCHPWLYGKTNWLKDTGRNWNSDRVINQRKEKVNMNAADHRPRQSNCAHYVD